MINISLLIILKIPQIVTPEIAIISKGINMTSIKFNLIFVSFLSLYQKSKRATHPRVIAPTNA